MRWERGGGARPHRVFLGLVGQGKELDFIPRGRRVLGGFKGGVVVKWCFIFEATASE